MLTPLGQMQRYDLVIEDADDKFWRVQVKTGWVDEGLAFIRFNTASSYNRTVQCNGRRTYRRQCKYFAVYALALKKVYFIPVDAVGKTNTTLHLTPSKNKQEKNVRWARDYEL